jgi:hypothetical protein
MYATATHQPVRRRCRRAAPLLAPLVLALGLCTLSSAAEAQIQEYKGNVFTNKGQSTVKEFGAKLHKAAAAIGAVQGLDVYVGHHGDLNGKWCAAFDLHEKGDVLKMKDSFPHATLHWLEKEMTDHEVEAAVKKGNAFFTWCDSDHRVSEIMKAHMPAHMKEFK